MIQENGDKKDLNISSIKDELNINPIQNIKTNDSKIEEKEKGKSEPIFNIPIARINMAYFQKMVQKKKRNNKNQKNQNNKQNTFKTAENINNYFPFYGGSYIPKNNSELQINNNLNNLNNKKNIIIEPSQDKKEKIQGNEDINNSKINDNSYNNKINLDLLSTGTSINEENDSHKIKKGFFQEDNKDYNNLNHNTVNYGEKLLKSVWIIHNTISIQIIQIYLITL